MDFLKAEINRKRKSLEEVTAVKAIGSVGSSKFMRQKDLLEYQEKQRLEAQRQLDDKRAVLEAERKAVESLSASMALQVSGAPLTMTSIDSVEKSDTPQLTVSQTKQRLRQLLQPITLFGETDNDRLRRLLSLQEQAGEEDDECRITSPSAAAIKGGKSLRRDIADDDEDDEDEDEDEDEDDSGDGAPRGDRDSDRRKAAAGRAGGAGSGSKKMGKASQADSDGEDSSEGEDDKLTSAQVTSSSAAALAGKRARKAGGLLSDQGLPAEKLVLKYFRSLLKQWEWDLNARDDQLKATARGKQETRTQKQCKDYIRPLFKMCKKKQVEYDILEKLESIARYCERGEFTKAHDQYLNCAIGKAAWPIGLTMVGIHERSGREKISTAKVAHIMNNELQRKYLSSVKRLMTYAQSKRPDIAPSQKVL